MTTEREQIGEDRYRYPDGSIRNSHGHWLERPPGSFTITKENAVALAQRKHERTQERIQERLLLRAQEEGLNARCPADAYAAGVEHLWARSLDVEEPLHAAVLAQKFTGQAGGLIAQDSRVEVNIGLVNIDQRVAAQLDELLDVVDAEFAPVDDG